MFANLVDEVSIIYHLFVDPKAVKFTCELTKFMGKPFLVPELVMNIFT